jgi:hypothetical protein
MSTGHEAGGGQTTMPAYDMFHDAVKRGLLKEGWRITDDPLIIDFGFPDVHIDAADEKIIAAERADERIAVEIKSFLGPSLLASFHLALGQYVNARMVMNKKDPGRILYLAVSKPVY